MSAFFSHIVAPYSVEDFYNTYHEKDILHVSRNNANYYNNILTSKEISDFLDRQDIFYPSLRIVKNGKELPMGEYTKKGVPIGHHKKDGVIHTEKAFALFNAGSTLVIQGGQRYFDNLSKCCLHLSNNFSSPVQANLYITPNKSQGFNPLWDTHDVFVLQISGTKTWQLYGFEKELPTKSQSFVSKGYDKKPIQTLQLSPGDFLYVPRGYVHDAMADDGISAHITIGILSYTWARFFTEAFPQLEEFKEFREAVPFWKGEELHTLVKEKLEVLKEKINQLDFNKSISRLSANHNKMQAQPVNNYFQSLLDIDRISSTSVFGLNEAVIYTIKKEEDTLKIAYLDKAISLPANAETIIDTMFEKKVFSFNDLPDHLPEENKKAFVRQLIKEGMIYVKQL